MTRRGFLGAAGGAAAVWSSASGRGTAAERLEPKFSLGLASYTFRKFSLDETLAMAQRLGFQYICLKSFHLPLEATPEQIREAAAKVKQAGLTLYGAGVVRMRSEEEVRRAFQYAQTAGMTCLISSPAPELLPLIDQQVKRYNVKVAIHNHGPGDQHFPTPVSVYKRVRDLDPRIGLCIDIGHTVRVGADLYAETEQCADRIHDLHMKDVSAATPEGHTVEIGRGVIDIPRYLRLLIRIGYAGVASFEHEKDPGDPLPGLAESVGYVRGALDTMGQV